MVRGDSIDLEEKIRSNSKDATIERNYLKNLCFLLREYGLVQAGKHPQFRFREVFYRFHGASRQTFYNCCHRYQEDGTDRSLLPQKGGSSWKSRRTLPFIEQKVLEQRHKGIT